MMITTQKMMNEAMAARRDKDLWDLMLHIAQHPDREYSQGDGGIAKLVSLGLLTSRSIYRHPGSPLAVTVTDLFRLVSLE